MWRNFGVIVGNLFSIETMRRMVNRGNLQAMPVCLQIGLGDGKQIETANSGFLEHVAIAFAALDARRRTDFWLEYAKIRRFLRNAAQR